MGGVKWEQWRHQGAGFCKRGDAEASLERACDGHGTDHGTQELKHSWRGGLCHLPAPIQR